jgi:hypothetical protein
VSVLKKIATISEADRDSLYNSFYSNYMGCYQIYRSRRNYTAKLKNILERDFISIYILEKLLFWKNGKYNMRPNAKDILHQETVYMARHCEDVFYKTFAYVENIIEKKGNLKKIDVLSTSTSAPGLDGVYQLFFHDGSKFNITIKAVLSCDSDGNPNIRSFMFFNLVYLSNGKMLTRNKYEDMIKDFCEYSPDISVKPRHKNSYTLKDGGMVHPMPIEQRMAA